MSGAADEARLLDRHADVLFRMDDHQRLVGLNELGDDPPPRLFLARGETTHRIWFGADVGEGTIETCRAIARELPRWDGQQPAASLYDSIRAALALEAPIVDETNGPAFRFGERVDIPTETGARVIDAASAQLLEYNFPYTRSILALRSPVVGIVVDGSVVSACYCARKRPNACEAGVDTVEPYRGRGFAALVVSAWRDAVETLGREPLYSTSWDNLASRAIAARLRLIPYAETVSLR
jgi:RimJ/RimL family protein N-acetyltransferase